MKAIFLYRELSTYFLSCVYALAQKYNIEIHIVYWPLNKEAPFHFNFPDYLNMYNKNDYDKNSLLDLTSKISPDLIYCSGWIDMDYLKVCKSVRPKVPVILGMDTQWKRTGRQLLASLAAPFIMPSFFSHCWVPGKKQYKYARRLGFTENRILFNLYSGDVNLFHSYYLTSFPLKSVKFPKRFLFAGRYNLSKGIDNLWIAFSELQNENPSEWELWCIGTGAVESYKHPKIKHFGFVQPDEMQRFISQTGVFVLPSRFEPWGVTVHEFAAAGFPLICSTEVGAADILLKDRENGFLFKAGNASELKIVLNKTMSMSDQELFAMGAKSAELAKQITPDKWADILYSVLTNQSG